MGQEDENRLQIALLAQELKRFMEESKSSRNRLADDLKEVHETLAQIIAMFKGGKAVIGWLAACGVMACGAAWTVFQYITMRAPPH